ncbi:MAG: hypothetical protein F6J94_02670 [Moorea sp. SIO1F2]|uniref:hypothetical protein n=1 Tax=unclassified Moorena TaxID=2683338 RepID=UPI0013B6B0A9|nr:MULTISPECIES: hypothetical protein [unclassified Moorena]NEO18672.1 hypothetical protein [Moorena sp. SIO4A5]NEQ56073.1 hypothetical protein [Moorena sp. SIO4A1]NET80917.1 hypothetical protein [Moorena sp. SIO1F2]
MQEVLSRNSPLSLYSRLPTPDSRLPIPDSRFPPKFVTKVFKLCYNIGFLCYHKIAPDVKR